MSSNGEIEYRRLKLLGGDHEIVMSGEQCVGYSGCTSYYTFRGGTIFEGAVKQMEHANQSGLGEAERITHEMLGSKETAADLDELFKLQEQARAIKNRIAARHNLQAR